MDCQNPTLKVLAALVSRDSPVGSILDRLPAISNENRSLQESRMAVPAGYRADFAHQCQQVLLRVAKKSVIHKSWIGILATIWGSPSK
jgi:hypothetical protein